MSPKELMYLEDALGHEQFLMTQCQQASQTLSDQRLKTLATQMHDQHRQIFDNLYRLVQGGQ